MIMLTYLVNSFTNERLNLLCPDIVDPDLQVIKEKNIVKSVWSA